MSFVLSLVFSGPCVYVPSADGRQLRVLVVAAGQPISGTDQRRHVPVLLFDPATLRNPADDPLREEIRDCGNGRNALLLGREAIHLEGTPDPGGSRAGRLSFDRTSDLENGLQSGRFRFDFMPRLDDVLPGAGDVDRRALLDVRPPASVAARALLERGEVFTATLSTLDGDAVRWSFLDNPDEDEGVLLGLDVGLEAGYRDEVRLVLRDFDADSRRVLRFAPPQDGGRVGLEISNRDRELVCDDRFRDDDGDLPRIDPDFAFNYRVASDPGLAKAVQPFPRVAGGDFEVSGTTCGGATGNPKP